MRWTFFQGNSQDFIGTENGKWLLKILGKENKLMMYLYDLFKVLLLDLEHFLKANEVF